MAQTHENGAPGQTSIVTIPPEIWDQIVQYIPSSDLPSMLLLSRAFCRTLQAHLYHFVYLPGTFCPYDHDFDLLPRQVPESDSGLGTQIFQPLKFMRTIQESPALRRHIQQASFAVEEGTSEADVEILGNCLNILHPSALHLELVNDYANLGLMSAVTSLAIKYPSNDKLADLVENNKENAAELRDNLRDSIYSLFMITTLRHLTLRDARCWCVFNPASDRRRIGTSNVVSLSLQNTVPMDRDLTEILTWPKALKCFCHDSEDGERGLFWRGAIGAYPSPLAFLEGIASQRETLEEVWYNNGQDQQGSHKAYFSPALISQFTRLRHLTVPRECLLGQFGGPHPLYTTLPPNLEELYLNQDYYMETPGYAARLKEWLQELLVHKESCLPNLRFVELNQTKSLSGTRHFDDYDAEARDRLDRMSLGSAFEKAGIQLTFVFY